MDKQYDVLVRLLILGDSGVGKTCLLRRFTDNEFYPSHISTIGVDFKMKTLEIDGLKVRVQIWDTAGQERYQTLTKQYYRRAQASIELVNDTFIRIRCAGEGKHLEPSGQWPLRIRAAYPCSMGIILVYDVTCAQSFQHIAKWASDVEEFGPVEVQRILVGNKSDEEHRRQVATQQGSQLGKSYDMSFFETSAWTNHHITEAFTRLTELVLRAHGTQSSFQEAIGDYLELAALEDEEGKDVEISSQKGCRC